ncbi:MAG TPA: (2Fe-2S)-binding protein [Acidobacteriota bacterium]|nr:(2Fe-2S)-binding protein [Acidobacteriota bacterium]
MPSKDDTSKEPRSGLSRRDFLKASSVTLSVPLVMNQEVVHAAGTDVKVYGPGKVPITLNINGKAHKAEVEPRVTLLETLRNELDLTGAKRVCDRASCGACTVIMNGRTAYSCTVLAIEAQGKTITTVEGLSQANQLHPIQKAIVENDGQQCGFCTPGFVVACKALLDKHTNPTREQIHRGLSGNLCRCGTYVGLKAALAQVGKAHAAPTAQKGGHQNG